MSLIFETLQLNIFNYFHRVYIQLRLGRYLMKTNTIGWFMKDVHTVLDLL